MISSQRLIGMCAVSGGETLGRIERIVLDSSAHRLFGIVLRRGIGGAKWIPRHRVRLMGQSCVLVDGRGEKVPAKTPQQPKHVKDSTGLSLGMVTDVLLCEKSLRVIALEISFGALYYLIGQRAYVTSYRLGRGLSGAEVVAADFLGRVTVRGEEGMDHEHWENGHYRSDRLRYRRRCDDDAEQSKAAAQDDQQDG